MRPLRQSALERVAARGQHGGGDRTHHRTGHGTARFQHLKAFQDRISATWHASGHIALDEAAFVLAFPAAIRMMRHPRVIAILHARRQGDTAERR